MTPPPTARLQTLGFLRCRILGCLGADNPQSPLYFDPPEEADLHIALVRHLNQAYHLVVSHPLPRLIVAAGRLSMGDVSWAEEILSSLPVEPVVDHGAGYCNIIPYTTVSALLPVPNGLNDAKHWVAHTQTAAALLAWFQRVRNDLIWDERAQRFVLREIN